MANGDQCHEIGLWYAYCLACTKKYQQTKIALVTFLTKLVLFFLENFYSGISSSDLPPHAIWCLDVCRWLSTRERLLQEIVELHKLQYNLLLGLFINSSGKS